MLENDTDTPPIKSKPSCLEMNENEVLIAEGLPSSYFKQSCFSQYYLIKVSALLLEDKAIW